VNPKDETAAAGRELAPRQLAALLACPACGTALAPAADATDVTCPGCGATYERLAFAWDLTPPRAHLTAEAWATWEELQANGVVAYEADPQNNLGIGEREDYNLFQRFADLRGLVLDIGCGPQEWPSHFSDEPGRAEFVGIDPLVGERPARYTRVRGLAEHLPFATGAFDQAVFATTLDHFVDPVLALAEARRVVSSEGTIDIWLGHKSPDAPRPPTSPAWYESLEEPTGADDLFHIKRMDDADARSLFSAAGLAIAAEETHRVDEYRTNHFYKLRAPAG